MRAVSPRFVSTWYFVSSSFSVIFSHCQLSVNVHVHGLFNHSMSVRVLVSPTTTLCLTALEVPATPNGDDANTEHILSSTSDR